MTDLSSLTKQLERLNDNIEKLLKAMPPQYAPMERKGDDHCKPVDLVELQRTLRRMSKWPSVDQPRWGEPIATCGSDGTMQMEQGFVWRTS